MKTSRQVGDAQLRTLPLWPATTSSARPMARWAAILSAIGAAGRDT